jgi:hypothetical protein
MNAQCSISNAKDDEDGREDARFRCALNRSLPGRLARGQGSMVRSSAETDFPAVIAERKQCHEPADQQE